MPSKSCQVCGARRDVSMLMDGLTYPCRCPVHAGVPPESTTQARSQFLAEGRTDWDKV